MFVAGFPVVFYVLMEVFMFIKVFIVLLTYNVVVHMLSYFAYLFCRKKKCGKECRNCVCRYAYTCEFNTVFEK